MENRARFGLEVIEAVANAVGPEKISVRLSPYSKWQDMQNFGSHAALVEQYSYYVKKIKELDVAVLHVVEGRVAGIDDQETGQKETLDFLVSSPLRRPSLERVTDSYPTARYLGA